MKIFHFLLFFSGLFIVFHIFAIGKRKHPEIASKPTATIRRVINQTGRTIILEIIDADRDWVDVMNILPGDLMINKKIPLSADAAVEYDLVRFDNGQEEEEPDLQLFLRIARVTSIIGHLIDVQVVFTLGIIDWSVDPATDTQIIDTQVWRFLIPEHTFDNYVIDITLRGQDLGASSFAAEVHTSPE